MEHLRIAEAGEFDNIYAILEASFPADERRSYEAQRALLARQNYRIYVLADREEILGLISLWQFEDFGFMEHFAVAEDYRCHGLGTALLARLRAMYPGQICLEAELPDTDLARRRLDFYRRNGFVPNAYPYVQPSYGPGREALPMVFLSSGAALSPARFLKMRETIYREVYGITQ